MSAAEPSPPGTGFLDAETVAAESPPKTRDARRDQKGPEPMAEIPVQTACLNLTGNYPVWEDWMVGATGIEPVTPSMSTSPSHSVATRVLKKSEKHQPLKEQYDFLIGRASPLKSR
jgi:hypothetical protein